MKTFDYEQVQDVLSPIKARLDDCAHGEGNQCETVDKHLECCAEICLEVHQAVRAWAQGVFTDRIVFDSDAEQLWLTELKHILARATGVWQMGKRAEVPCFELNGQRKLEIALWHLNYLVRNWVTPKPSVAPSPRVRPELTETERDVIRRQLASLPAPPPRGGPVRRTA